MKDHNYVNTFIAVAEDCPVEQAKIPKPRGGRPTVATMQFEMLHGQPFTFTQEDVLFEVWLGRNHDNGDIEGLSQDELAALRDRFFAKGQPCLRASPLTKTHGWGVQFDDRGRAALVAMETPEYRALAGGDRLTVLPAMRSKRA